MSRSRIKTAASKADWRNVAINSALVVCSLLISLAVSEYLVRKLTHFPIHSPISNRVTDERLLFRTSHGDWVVWRVSGYGRLNRRRSSVKTQAGLGKILGLFSCLTQCQAPSYFQYLGNVSASAKKS